jgi:hypothetical protein
VVGTRYAAAVVVARNCCSTRYPNPFAALRIDVVDARGTWNENVRHVVLHILETGDEPN